MALREKHKSITCESERQHSAGGKGKGDQSVAADWTLHGGYAKTTCGDSHVSLARFIEAKTVSRMRRAKRRIKRGCIPIPSNSVAATDAR